MCCLVSLFQVCRKALQFFHCRTFDAHVHVSPLTDLGQAVDIIIGNVHSSGVANLSVDDDNLLMVTAECVVDVRKTDRVEYPYVNSFVAEYLQVFFSQRAVVRHVSEGIEHGSDLDSFFGFPDEDFKQLAGDGVIPEVKIFQMNVFLGFFYLTEQVFELFSSARQQFQLIVESGFDMLFL